MLLAGAALAVMPRRVLRDLAAPSFQAKNSAADLAPIFAALRARHIDLFAVALIGPQ